MFDIFLHKFNVIKILAITDIFKQKKDEFILSKVVFLLKPPITNLKVVKFCFFTNFDYIRVVLKNTTEEKESFICL